VIAKGWVVQSKGQQTCHPIERGIHGIFIVFPPNQKGYMIYLPVSQSIASSGDVHFDKTFYLANATAWKWFEDGISLQPKCSFIPDPIMEDTGDMTHNPTETDIPSQDDDNQDHISLGSVPEQPLARIQ
jgi:hypothetical protein